MGEIAYINALEAECEALEGRLAEADAYVAQLEGRLLRARAVCQRAVWDGFTAHMAMQVRPGWHGWAEYRQRSWGRSELAEQIGRVLGADVPRASGADPGACSSAGCCTCGDASGCPDVCC